MPETPKKSKKKILIPIIIAAAVVALIFAVILPAVHSTSYKKAMALMEEGKYAEAQERFAGLKTYMDSSRKAKVCAKYMEAEEIYGEAMELYSAGDWEAAEDKFDEILDLEDEYFKKDFRDTKELVEDCRNHQTYEAAEELMSSKDSAEDLKKAQEQFESLGDFEDAAERAEECREMIRQLNYKEAAELMSHDTSTEDLEAAKAFFLELGDYKDAKTRAEDCTKLIELNETYQKAEEALEDSDYAGAQELYDTCGDFADSKEKSEICSLLIDFSAAVDHYVNGEYNDAETALENLESTYQDTAEATEKYPVPWEDPFTKTAGTVDLETVKSRTLAETALLTAEKQFKDGKYSDAAEKLQEIDASLLTEESASGRSKLEQSLKDVEKYKKAEEYFNAGQFYEAYKAFLDCGDYSDAAKRAESCIQPYPATGVVYANDAYGDRSSELTINNSGYKNAYYKLYFGSDLVMTIFIPENGSATFALPSGTYRMTKGYGDTWFGTIDMFGDDGRYWVCSFGGSETAAIDPGYAYEISTGGEGTGIGTSESDRGSI